MNEPMKMTAGEDIAAGAQVTIDAQTGMLINLKRVNPRNLPVTRCGFANDPNHTAHEMNTTGTLSKSWCGGGPTDDPTNDLWITCQCGSLAKKTSNGGFLCSNSHLTEWDEVAGIYEVIGKVNR